MTEPTRDHVQSLARGLAVIRVFGAEHPRQSLSDVARATGLTRATARRVLLTLAELGYVRADGPLFALTPRVLELGYSYLSSLTLPEVAGPHLETLTKHVDESSSVSVLDGFDIVYVARVPVRRIMTVSINIGTRFPAFATSMGRVLLAGLSPTDLTNYLSTVELIPLTDRSISSKQALRQELSRIRRHGFCVVDQELEEGLRSVAAPVRDKSGNVVAAINVSTQSIRCTMAAVRKELLPPLLHTAAAIGADLARMQR